MHHGRAIIVFVRHPEKGKVKTRLAKEMGDDEALKVYRQLLQITRQAVEKVDADLWVFYAESIPASDMWSSITENRISQQGDELGDRIKQAFELVFSKGFQQVLLVGSDCPDLSAYVLNKAYDILTQFDVCIGPTVDGGYYLVGCRQHSPGLFEQIDWSTHRVLTQTLRQADLSNLDYALLPKLSDIDTLDDLKNFPELFQILSKR